MTRDDLLAELLERYDEARAGGREVTPEQLCRHCPELLAPFTRLLRQLDDVFAGGNAPPPAPIDAGRYTPTEQVGEGGLGVVYRATDGELGRVVALKWMKPLAALNSAARHRFRVEAEITGKLEHPGVAPVYGAGEEPDTRMPYYAMRFIEGQTLADHIRAYHTTPGEPAARRVEFTRLLRAFTAVCQTVAYAHSRGVVHRDIKPGNVMLGPYGETLLVDWGLAKEFDPDRPADPTVSAAAPVELVPVESAETAGAAQTVSGRAKGTIQYMPPEQARGQWDQVGPAADVYALGATLYTLLAGHSPYSEAKDKLAAVKAGPPRAVRKVNPAAPKPLAAVCAKAMARTPEGRYATAQGLAADVERWLADEPVTAYRDPLFTRGRRWVKRHRTLTAAVAAALLVLTAALAVVAPILTAKNQELAQANGDLGKANGDLTDANANLAASAEAAQANYEEADAAVLGMIELAFVRSGGGANDPVLSAQRAALSRYRDYQKRFIARNGRRQEMRVEVAVAWLKAGEMDYTLNRPAEAAEAAAEAERLFAELKAERPDDREVLFGSACARVGRGQVLADRGQVSEAEPLLASARDTFQQLAADPTPLRIARLGSTTGPGHRDSPSFRLAAVTVILAEVREQAKRAERAAGMLGRPSDPRGYRDDLKAALTALTGDKPLPAGTSITTWLMALQLRLRLALLDPDPDAGVKALLAVSADAKVVAEQYPAASEFWVVAEEAEATVGQAEMAYARGVLTAMRAAADAGRVDEVKRLGAEWERAFDSAHARLTRAVGEAERLEQADLGLDLSDVAGSALAIQVEIGGLLAVMCDELNNPADLARILDLTLDALQRLAKRKPLSPEAATRGVAAATAVGGVAYMASKKGPAKGEAVNAYVKRTADLKAKAAAAVGHAATLNDRLLELSPGEPHYLRMKAYLCVTRLDTAAERGEPTGPLIEQAEAAIELLRGDPTDWFVVLLDVLLLNSRAGLEADTNKNLAGAVKMLERATARLDDGENLGMPGACADLFRIMITTTTAAALRIQAEALLDGPAADRPKARPLIDRGLTLLRDSVKATVREDPDPDIQQRLEFVRWRRGQALKDLEQLDARANPKK